MSWKSQLRNDSLPWLLESDNPANDYWHIAVSNAALWNFMVKLRNKETPRGLLILSEICFRYDAFVKVTFSFPMR